MKIPEKDLTITFTGASFLEYLRLFNYRNSPRRLLGGGFKDVLFSPLLGEMIQSD